MRFETIVLSRRKLNVEQKTNHAQLSSPHCIGKTKKGRNQGKKHTHAHTEGEGEKRRERERDGTK